MKKLLKKTIKVADVIFDNSLKTIDEIGKVASSASKETLKVKKATQTAVNDIKNAIQDDPNPELEKKTPVDDRDNDTIKKPM